MRKLSISNAALMASVFCAVMTIAASAQTYQVLAKFSSTTGEGTNSPLVQGTNGNFFTTAQAGGANESSIYCNNFDQDFCGTFLEITSAGKLTVIYSFCAQANCADGGNPAVAPVLAPNGNFYGTTSTGGTSPASSCQWLTGCGTIFEITPAGKLTVLHNVCSESNCADGLAAGRLVLGANGNFYGTTTSGGILNGDAGCPYGCGTIFTLSPAGKFTTLYKFCSEVDSQGDCADGVFPVYGLVQAENGKFYGMTYDGGTSGVGNIFEITAAGKLTPIYSFCSQPNCADGRSPSAPLILGKDGNLYGTTSSGGAYGGGTAFAITPTGHFTTLYSFCNWATNSCPDGSSPSASLTQGSDGNLYGTTSAGGIVNGGLCLLTGCGTTFQITAIDQLNGLYSFCAQTSCSDGAYPGAMMQATNGNFYGVATKGGRPGCIVGGGCGTAWSLSLGLGPFVQANPGFGHVGQRVNILGNHLTGATSVTFDGTPAKFKVVSDAYIVAALPTGASSGRIEVTTSNGTLSSNVDFKVLP